MPGTQVLVNPDQPQIDSLLAHMKALYPTTHTLAFFEDTAHRNTWMHQLDGFDPVEVRWSTVAKPDVRFCAGIAKGGAFVFLYESGHAALFCRLRLKTIAFFGYTLDSNTVSLTRRPGCYPCIQIEASCAAQEPELPVP